MSDINESYVSGIPSGGLTRERANTHEPVRVDPAVDGPTGGDPAIPVTRIGSGDNLKEVFGEYMNMTSPTRIRVKTRGVLTLKSSVKYAKAMNGQGVQATGQASVGLVENAGGGAELGTGLGYIFGGFTRGTQEYLKVYVP